MMIDPGDLKESSVDDDGEGTLGGGIFGGGVGGVNYD
jgi:hypothetical protein